MAHRGEQLSLGGLLDGATRWGKGSTVPTVAVGVLPRRCKYFMSRCLTFAQREALATLRAHGLCLRVIRKAIGRSPSTVSRESKPNTKPGTAYGATTAHVLAYTGQPDSVQTLLKAAQRKNWIQRMITISERPPGVEDRAVPGLSALVE